MRKLKGGHHDLSPQQVTESQIGRMIRAEINLAGRAGFGPAKVGDVIGLAGVSRATFYKHYTDRYELFVAARAWLEGRIEQAFEAARADCVPFSGFEAVAGRGAGNGEAILPMLAVADRVLSAVEAVPGATTFGLQATPVAGPGAVALHLEFLERWSARLHRALGRSVDARKAGRRQARMGLGAALATVAAYDRRGEPADRAEVVGAALIPVFGADRAYKAVRAVIV